LKKDVNYYNLFNNFNYFYDLLGFEDEKTQNSHQVGGKKTTLIFGKNRGFFKNLVLISAKNKEDLYNLSRFFINGVS
jgi:hypothetical protein